MAAMRYAHTVAQVRDAEAPLLASLPAGGLMQRAVAGITAHAVRRLGRVYGARVVVLAGGGDNGGDALWAGARLAARGAGVDAVAPGRTHPQGSAALLAAGGRLHPFSDGGGGAGGAGGDAASVGAVGADEAARLVGAADLVLDGLLGIGGRGGLRGSYAQLAHLAEVATPERTVAVDAPSGVDPDTGAVPGPAIRAGSTVTFGTYKRGLLIPPGAYHAGRIELVDIGLTLPPPDLSALDEADVAALAPRPGPEATKYTRGVLGLVAGSDPYPGAAVLAAGGALRSGAGYLRVATTAEAARAVRAAHPEAVVTTVSPGDADAVLRAGRVQAWAVGSGLPPGPPTSAVVLAVLGADVPVLLDAGALDAYAAIHAEAAASGGGDASGGGEPSDGGGAPGGGKLPDRGDAPLLLTPHEGEFVRLTELALGWDPSATSVDLAADRLGAVRRAAAALGATVLLKGSHTLVVDPDGTARVNTTGTSRLAAAGSGDVLTGLVGGLLAAGLSPLDAGSVGAWLHGRAARLAPAALTASDLPALLVQVLAELGA
jgi:hydroxyethylthiazole kinase-like uncharacterized protein yjeF